MTELVVERLVAGGEGLSFAAGKAIFVPGVLPGERVRVRTVVSRRDFERAALVEVLEASPRRVAPACPLAGTCGGCDWLHVDYREQLVQKLAIVREALRRTGGLTADHPVFARLGIEPSPPLGARSRVQLHRAPGGGLGFMAARSDRVVPTRACPAMAPALEGLLRGERAAPGGLDRFTAWTDGTNVAVEGIDDDLDVAVVVRARRILFSVGCFFQSNLSVLDALVGFALDGLGDVAGATAADLYAGVGLFGTFLAAGGASVTIVESSATSTGYARRNLPGDGHAFFPLPVEGWLAAGAAGAAAPARFDAVVVDPPRTGLSAAVRDWLAARPPRRLAYVSCNPVTLARDLGVLVRSGFVLEGLRLFDFYPQTSHVEAVAHLRGPEHTRTGD